MNAEDFTRGSGILMTKQEALKYAHELREKGFSLKEIGHKLADAGYIRLNGKPFEPPAICHMLGPRKGPKIKAPAGEKPIPKVGMEKAVAESKIVLSLSFITPEQKIKLIEQILK